MASEQRSREEVIPSSSSSPPLQSVAEKRKEEISIEATTDKKTTFHASQDKETEIAVGSLVGSFSSSSLSKVSLPRHLFISVTSPPSLRRYLYSHVSPLETSPSSCCIADIKSLDSSSSSLSSSPPSSYSFSSLILKELKAWRDTSSSFSSSSSSFSPSISSSRGVCWQERLLLERRESLPSFLSSASAFLKAVKERIRGIEKDIASPRRNKGDFAEDTTASAESSQEKKRKGEEEKKEKKEKSPEDDVVLILGNPSADLDSIAAAIGYAMFLETCRYLLDGLLFSSITFPPRVERKDEEEKSIEEEEERKKDQQEKTKKKEREEGTGEGLTSSYLPRFLPVVQCLKKEYKFRLQTRWWMEIALGKRIDQEEKEEEEMFLFIDHPVIFKLLEEKLDMWQVPLLGLVDHNALSLRLAPLQPNVVSIVDHHVPDPHLLSFSFSSSSSASDGLHVYPVVSPGLPLAVDIPGPSIGSCCTLIFQLWNELEEEISPSSSGDDKQGSACIQGHGECRLLPQDLALLLLGAVAVDTTACDPLLYKKRWTDPDEVALKSLWGRCERTLISSRGVCTPQDLVEKFGRIKYNVQQQLSLGVKALLISDYKEFDYPTAIITTTATAPSSSSSAAAVELVKVGVPALTVPLSILLSCDDEVSHDVLNSSFSSSSSSLSLPSDLLSQYIQSAKCLIQENHLDFLISVSNYRPPSSLSSSSGLSRQLAMMSLSRYDCVLQDLSEFLSSQEELHSTDDRELRVKKIEISGHPKNTHTTDRLSSGKEDPSESEEGDREEPPVAHCIYFFPHISPSYSRKLLEPILRQFFYSSSSSSPWRTQDISS